MPSAAQNAMPSAANNTMPSAANNTLPSAAQNNMPSAANSTMPSAAKNNPSLYVHYTAARATRVRTVSKQLGLYVLLANPAKDVCVKSNLNFQQNKKYT